MYLDSVETTRKYPEMDKNLVRSFSKGKIRNSHHSHAFIYLHRGCERSEAKEVPKRTKGVTIRGLSQREARWKCDSREDAGYLQRDEKTPRALLYLDIDFKILMRSVVGRLWSFDFGRSGAVNETPIFEILKSNLGGKNIWGQCLVGSFSGAELSKKVTERFIRSAKAGWKSAASCKGTSRLNSEAYKPNWCESKT